VPDQVPSTDGIDDCPGAVVDVRDDVSVEGCVEAGSSESAQAKDMAAATRRRRIER
jgi:hypothetical protein